MNREDIIRMAREAGMDAPREIVVNNYWTADYDDIERFAALIAAAEREACAKICDDMVLYTGFDCADAIRAMGQE